MLGSGVADAAAFLRAGLGLDGASAAGSARMASGMAGRPVDLAVVGIVEELVGPVRPEEEP